MSYMTCEYKINAIKPLIPNQNINLEVLDSPAYINSSTTKFRNIISKIIIEGKFCNWIRLSIYKHVQIIKNKESHILQDKDEVTHGTGLARCSALYNNVELWSHAAGLANATTTMLAFFFF